MIHISNPFKFGSLWNNKSRERRTQIALASALAESTSRTLSHNTDSDANGTDITGTDVFSTEHNLTLLRKEFTPTLAGSGSRALSLSTDVTNGGWLTRHSQRLLHEDQAQHTGIRSGGMCDTSTIQNLPVEVLGEIFRHCVEAAANNGWPFGYANPDKRWAPLLLCSVCTHWRQVAISTPVLWSKFSAQLARRLPTQLIQLWLDRSQAHPLSFHISQWRASQAELLPHAHHILKLFFPHFSRCYDLIIVLDDTLVRQLLSIPIEDKSSVESFTLDTNICTQESVDQIPDLIQSFTNIRRLSIHETSTDIMSQSSLQVIPWSQLTHIEFRSRLAVDTVAVILAQCVQIVEFTVDFVWPDVALGASTPILARHLRYLQIHCFCDNHEPGAQCDVEALLQFLTLPALRQFKFYHTGGHPATWGRVIFSEFLIRSGCLLESITIFERDLVEDDIIALLSLPHLQSLKEIGLHSVNVSDRTLELLTYPSSGTGVLPNLESIDMSWCSASDGKLADMIASRWSPNPTTRKISRLGTLKYDYYEPTYGARPCHDQDYSRIGTFRADGLKVVG